VAETCHADDIFTSYVSPGINLSFNIFDPNGSTLSDTLQITSAAGSNEFLSTFQSDIEPGTLLPLLGGTSIVEDGTVQTAAIIALNGGFPGQNFIVRFQSDVDAATPEPRFIGLLTLGMLGMAITAKRRRSGEA
jgi:predicted Rdx family selenoprotein